LWLGSSIGNYSRSEAAAFLKKLRETAMQPGRHTRGTGGVTGCNFGYCVTQWFR
jgi:hypothetical protein